MRLCFAVVMVPLLASASASLALAEEAPVEAVTEQEVVETLVTLNRKAVTQYRGGHHAEAQKLLQEALTLAEQHDLVRHDITARTYVHLGIVAVAQGKSDEARQSFARALQIRPDIKLT
jgi:Tfp pilus assembly protein PilF